MENKDVNINLYHADWCGHCINFMPEWEKIVKKAKKDGINAQGFKDTDPETKEEDITGYPTIKITIGDEKYDYSGSRTLEDIFKFIDDKRGSVQDGGGKSDEYYKLKYLKYKAKYLKKKGQMF